MENDLVNPIRISKQFIIIIICYNGCYGRIYYTIRVYIILIILCVSCITIITSLYDMLALGEGRLATVRTLLSREGFSLLLNIYIYIYIFSSDSSIVSENRFFVFRSVSTVHNINIVTIHFVP